MLGQEHTGHALEGQVHLTHTYIAECQDHIIIIVNFYVMAVLLGSENV